MDIIASIPSIIKKRRNDINVYVAVYPLLTSHEFLDKLKNSFDITASCENYSFPECFAMIYGGVVISKGQIVERLELDGCVKIDEKRGKEFDVNEFLKDPYDCYSFDDGVMCISDKKNKDCKVIDNIGLRFIIT